MSREDLLNREKERQSEGESWLYSELLQLRLIETRIYLATVFLQDHSIKLPINVHSLAYKVPSHFFLCLSRFLCFSSSFSHTVTGGRATIYLLPSSFLLSLSFPVPRQTDRVPGHFPWISCFGLWSDTSWLLETMLIFQAPETLRRAGIYLQGWECRARASAHSHTETICSPKLEAR